MPPCRSRQQTQSRASSLTPRLPSSVPVRSVSVNAPAGGRRRRKRLASAVASSPPKAHPPDEQSDCPTNQPAKTQDLQTATSCNTATTDRRDKPAATHARAPTRGPGTRTPLSPFRHLDNCGAAGKTDGTEASDWPLPTRSDGLHQQLQESLQMLRLLQSLHGRSIALGRLGHEIGAAAQSASIRTLTPSALLPTDYLDKTAPHQADPLSP
jgi:hypothetical protein